MKKGYLYIVFLVILLIGITYTAMAIQEKSEPNEKKPEGPREWPLG